MAINARYAHTNLVAHDFRRLCSFYEQVFGCKAVPPERDLQGGKLEAGTGIPGARLRGMHLRLPGFGDGGPTLEVFNYNLLESREKRAANRPGFGHIAFSVDDVGAAQSAVMEAGGQKVGEIVSFEFPGKGKITWCYVTDPEDNIIELQAWTK